METNVQTLVQSEETMRFVVAEATEENAAQKKNAPESAELGASLVACATHQSTTEYSTKLLACQIAAVPTLQAVEDEIAAAARPRIDTALRELSETRARIERERKMRETAVSAAQERADRTQADLNGIAGERTAMERRAQTFLAGDVLKLALGNIHVGFNAKQLELEDALATAQADVRALEEEMQAAAVTDALEIQMAEQYLDELEAAAPMVAQAVRLAASAEENLAAAQQAVSDGRLNDVEILLDKAKAGNADPSKIAPVEAMLAAAKQEQKARVLIFRINAVADQPRAVRRIRNLIAEAEQSGLTERIAPTARRALRIARDAANARFAQARPIAEHLADEGCMPVIGDGRIEAWKQVSKNSADARGHVSTSTQASDVQRGASWMLDRVMLLHGDVWETRTPRVPVTRRELPKQVERSRWFNHPPARDPVPTQ